jgi:hypothetical protein
MVIPLGGAAISSNNEIFCGGYLNQIIGQAVPGTVTGMFLNSFPPAFCAQVLLQAILYLQFTIELFWLEETAHHLT